jgi:hypothetical protein
VGSPPSSVCSTSRPGEVDLLTLAGQGSPEFAFVRMAALAPDGETVLFWSRLTDPDNQIFARSIGEDEAVPLLPEGMSEPSRSPWG